MRVAAGGDERAVGVEVVQLGVGDLEADVDAVGQVRGDEVLHDLLLAVDEDRASGEVGEVDAMTPAGEAQFGAVVRHALGVHAAADARLAQRLGRPVFEHAGAHACLDVGARARFEHHRFDALQVQQPGEQESRRTRADDRHLGAHPLSLLHPTCSMTTGLRPPVSVINSVCATARMWRNPS